MQEKIGNTLLIRRMIEQDLDVVSRIESEVATHPWNKELFISCAKMYDSVVATIDDGSVIGYGIIAIYGSIHEAHVLNLGVDQKWQGMGVGGRLLDYLINSCTAINNKIFLEVNKNNLAAICLYKKFKFIEVSVRKNYYNTKDGKEDALVFLLQDI